MSKQKELLKIIEKALPFPVKVIAGYAKLDASFTSGDLAKICNVPNSSAKFYLGKMIELRMVTRVPHKKRYQKFSNSETVSSWLKDLIRIGLIPLESGSLKIPDEE